MWARNLELQLWFFFCITELIGANLGTWAGAADKEANRQARGFDSFSISLLPLLPFSACYHHPLFSRISSSHPFCELPCCCFALHFHLFQYSSKLAPLTIPELLLLFLHSSSSPKLNNKIKSTKLCILRGCWKLGNWTWKPDFFSWSLLASPSFSTLCCQPHFSSSPSHQKLKLRGNNSLPPSSSCWICDLGCELQSRPLSCELHQEIGYQILD